MVDPRIDSSGCPEWQLLVSYARTDAAGNRPVTTTSARMVGDWSQVLRMAIRNGTMPLLYGALKDADCFGLPENVMERLRNQYTVNERRNLLLAGELLDLVSAFAQEAVPVLPYKGPVLASAVYRDISLRQSGDLDLLVPERGFSPARRILLSRGFHTTYERGWETTFVKDASGVEVDLHRSVTQSSFPVAIDFDQLWSRRVSVPVCGRDVPSLSMEDILLILCIQVAKDTWEDRIVLSKVCDVAEVVRSDNRIDWQWLVDEAGRLGSKRMLFVALRLARDLLGAPVPGQLWSNIIEDRSIGRLTDEVLRRLRDGEISHAGLPSRVRFFFSVRERLRDKFRQLRIVPEKLAEAITSQEVRRA